MSRNIEDPESQKSSPLDLPTLNSKTSSQDTPRWKRYTRSISATLKDSGVEDRGIVPRPEDVCWFLSSLESRLIVGERGVEFLGLFTSVYPLGSLEYEYSYCECLHFPFVPLSASFVTSFEITFLLHTLDWTKLLEYSPWKKSFTEEFYFYRVTKRTFRLKRNPTEGTPLTSVLRRNDRSRSLWLGPQDVHPVHHLLHCIMLHSPDLCRYQWSKNRNANNGAIPIRPWILGRSDLWILELSTVYRIYEFDGYTWWAKLEFG